MDKFSIITVTYNSATTIEATIKSVLGQSCPNVEYIIIDGGSTDGTLEVVDKYRSKISKVISEKDSGIYNAINKGIRLATGDIIGILNSDDLYASYDVLKKITEIMNKTGVDVCWGDLVCVGKNNPDRIKRYWRSSEYKEGKFRRGWMPPHPTFFVRREVYKKYGLFNTDFKIAADYELMLRFLEKNKVRSYYIPETLVKMRVGGKTGKSIFNIFNIIRYKWEDYYAWKVNGLKINTTIIFWKSFSKIPQLFSK